MQWDNEPSPVLLLLLLVINLVRRSWNLVAHFKGLGYFHLILWNMESWCIGNIDLGVSLGLNMALATAFLGAASVR